MSKKVWLYTEKNIGIYYCIDDDKYYYKNMAQANLPLAVGIAIVWSVVFRYLNKIDWAPKVWNTVFIVTNVLWLIFLCFLKENEERKYHQYYPAKDQFINNMPLIRKIYIKELFAVTVLSIMMAVSIYGCLNYSNKLMWLAIEMACVILLYCITSINGMVFKRKIIRQIKAGKI